MKRKLLATYFLLIVVGILITGFFSFRFINTTYLESIQESLMGNGNLINTILLRQEASEEMNYFALSQKFAKQINARVTFIDSLGNVLADSENNSIIFINHADRPEVRKALSGEIGLNAALSLINGKKLFFVAMPPIKLQGKSIITRLSVPLTEIDKLISAFLKNVVFSIILGLIVAISAGYLYIDKFTKPIREITEASKLISLGQFDKKVEVSSNDEIKNLADNFNIMAYKLNEMINELNYNNLELNAIMTSMLDGVVAVNDNGNILLLNPAARTLLNIKEIDLIEKNILEVVENEEILKLISETLRTQSVQEAEIPLGGKGGKILKVFTNRIDDKVNFSNSIGVLMIIHDITEIRKLEKIRSEFVVNASHELKTPLTSISGFIETLRFGEFKDERQRERVLEIIEIETKRLKRIVSDMLTLSYIENTKDDQTLEDVYVYEVIEEVIDICRPMADKKKIGLIMEVEEELDIMLTSEDLFKQMVLNLVDNAVKYTSECGIVKVKAYVGIDTIQVTVTDNGIGIPQQEIPRLFERFYRIDKARSRKAGGTGLGLAIVKHIVLKLKGSIKVTSEVGRGSEFIVEIPLSENNNSN